MKIHHRDDHISGCYHNIIGMHFMTISREERGDIILFEKNCDNH